MQYFKIIHQEANSLIPAIGYGGIKNSKYF